MRGGGVAREPRHGASTRRTHASRVRTAVCDTAPPARWSGSRGSRPPRRGVRRCRPPPRCPSPRRRPRRGTPRRCPPRRRGRKSREVGRPGRGRDGRDVGAATAVAEQRRPSGQIARAIPDADAVDLPAETVSFRSSSIGHMSSRATGMCPPRSRESSEMPAQVPRPRSAPDQDTPGVEAEFRGAAREPVKPE